ncbi:MerR family transcriptional regulator [Microbispora sp. H13382]|uniref:MerR family transcriptional regulator n=1 Tax=Microbispora sp. H13382 TaxID=2729112 RepID=UPI001604586D|nr:MerR family transcriptional regulator [Microbispora sp. H13382]
MDEGMTIARVAQRTGLTARTLRYHERAGLARRGRDTYVARQELLEAHRADVIAEIEQLRSDLEVVDHKIGLYRRRITGEQ